MIRITRGADAFLLLHWHPATPTINFGPCALIKFVPRWAQRKALGHSAEGLSVVFTWKCSAGLLHRPKG